MLEIKQDKKEEFDVNKDSPGGLSFKQYFFPPEEKMFPVPKPPKKFVLTGLSKIDLEALVQLDEIMSKPKQDFYYWQRRKRAEIVPLGSDASKLSEWQETMRKLLVDSELLADAVAWSHSHKIWDELAEKCFGCGVCTYVCPLCYCFSLEDKIGLDNKCSRCRKWDACTLPGFAKIAGGHSFRPTLKERYYNWFYHKFVRAYKEYGKSQCVGCERCKNQCPAKIDILEVLKIILEDYGKYLSSQKS